MFGLNKILFQATFCVIFFYQICLVKNQCVNNNLSLENEEDNVILSRYLEKLEFFTGLSNRKPTVAVKCPNSICVVNPQGSAIWEARLDFYMPYVLNSSTSSGAPTLDGCLCHSKNYDNFQRCMQEVRRNMLDQLDLSLLQDFKRRVENYSCRSYNENCLQTF